MSGGLITGNSANGGAGIFVHGAVFTMSGGSISANEGNGVYVFQPSSTFTMSGGIIESNSGFGVGLEMEPVFIMSGSAVVSSNNEVFLPTGRTITINGALTGTSPVATIYMNDYESEEPVQVLAGDYGVSSNYTRFAVANPIWGVDSNGKLAANLSINITADLSFPAIYFIDVPASVSPSASITISPNVVPPEPAWIILIDGVSESPTSGFTAAFAAPPDPGDYNLSVLLQSGTDVYSGNFILRVRD
jgi:hypothetical protein